MIHTSCKIIGLTGGIASGKSTVSSMLVDKGFIVIDADKISREIVEIGRPAYNKLLEFFGPEILNEDKTINRRVLGSMVFSNEDLLKALNNITHPFIFRKIRKEIDKACKNNNIIF